MDGSAKDRAEYRGGKRNTVTTTVDTEQEKRRAAAASLEYVRDGMCLGLGSGSTATIMLAMLGERVRQGLHIAGVPTSEASRRLAIQAGITLLGFDQVSQLDLTIDGADQVDRDLNLIKGGGGALLREKIVASFSRRVIIIVDSGKQAEKLGAFALPVEVVRFAWQPIAERLRGMGAEPRLRTDDAGVPLVTDEGNYILDCDFGTIDDPPGLARELDSVSGVMEHGLFVGQADVLLVGRSAEVLVIER
jgi:ribose 5-phosphate isomerase A